MPSLIELQERLAIYRAAEKAILEGHQAYTIGSQQYTRANLGQVQAQIRSLEQQIAAHPDSMHRGRLSHSQAVFGGCR